MVDAPHRCNIFVKGLSDNSMKKLIADSFEDLSKTYENVDELKNAFEVEDGELSIIGQGSGLRCDLCNKFRDNAKKHAEKHCADQKSTVSIKYPGKCLNMSFAVDKTEDKENTVIQDKKDLLNMFIKIQSKDD